MIKDISQTKVSKKNKITLVQQVKPVNFILFFIFFAKLGSAQCVY